MIVITVFTLFVLYTIACCMDGPDLKPKWKHWLGVKLEGYADRLKPIDYCVREKCKYYELATVKLPQYMPPVVIHNFDAVPVESRIVLSESEMHEALMYHNMVRQHGLSEWQIPPYKSVPFMVEEAKKRCVRNLLDEAKQFASIEVDEESRWPGIVITAKMMVGKNLGKSE